MIHRITTKSDTKWQLGNLTIYPHTHKHTLTQTHTERECVCMGLIHTCVCACDLIVQNCFILSSSRHTQQAGLRRRRVPYDQETLEGDTHTHGDSFQYVKCDGSLLSRKTTFSTFRLESLQGVAPWQPGGVERETVTISECVKVIRSTPCLCFCVKAEWI